MSFAHAVHKSHPTRRGTTAAFALILAWGVSACGGTDTESTASPASPTKPATLAAPSIGSFSAAPTTITAGQSSVLSWSTTGATSVSISGLGQVSGSSVSVSPAATTTYILTATNTTGGKSASTSITVQPAQTPATTAQITTAASPTQGGSTSGGGPSATGTLVHAKAVPTTGYYFVNWTEGPYGAVVSNSANYDFKVTAAPLLPDRALVANFAPTTTKASITIMGTPTYSMSFTGAGSYAIGDTATVVVPANMNGVGGFGAFMGWGERGVIVSTQPSYSFTVTGPRVLEPAFETPGRALNVFDMVPGSDNILVDGDTLSPLYANGYGGTPPYKYQWTFENSTTTSQSEVASPGTRVGYGASAVGPEAYDPAQAYAGPNNYVSLTVTDSVGASFTKKIRVSIFPILNGNVIAKPGRRAYRITADGNTNAHFLVYIPASYNPQTPAPVIFNEDGVIWPAYQTAADAMNFILVAPPAFNFVSDPTQFHLNLDSHEVTVLALADRLFKGVNINRKHVLMTGHSRWGYPSWFLGAKHPEIFTELAFESSNFYEDGQLDAIWLNSTTWQTRPIYQVWGENDRSNVLTENQSAGTFLKNRVQAKKLTQYVVPGGGHSAWPAQVTEWWKGILAN